MVAQETPVEPPLTARTITRFYSPLALSWVFMAIELPIAIGVVSRLPEPSVSTAAFLVIMSISMWIESPVIDLLTTSTTLAKDSDSYLRIRSFVIALMAWVTFAHAAVVFTPLYDIVVRGILHIPDDVATAAWPGLALMTPWSAFIGWRRFRQGVLIRYGETRAVGFGTAIRVSTMAVLGVGFPQWLTGPSVALVSGALVLSVAAESIFIHFASASCVSQKLHREPKAEPLTGETLRRFHFPLTVTTLLTLTALPIISAALSRTPDSVVQLASFQVAQSLVWLHRTIVFALPEVVITLAKTPDHRSVLRRYCLRVGIACSGLQALFGLFGLDRAFFATVLQAKPDLLDGAHTTYLWSAFMPLIGAAQSYVRAMLTAIRQTSSRLYATILSTTVLALGLAAGVLLHMPGVIFAPVSLSLSLLADLGILLFFWSRRRDRSLG